MNLKFSALKHAVFYVIIMFVCQYIVSAGYMISLIDSTAIIDGNYESFIITASEALMSKIVLITLISNLLTLLVVCAIFHLRKKDPAAEMGIRKVNFYRIPTFAILGAALNITVSVTLSLLPLPEGILEALDSQYESLYGESNLALELFSVAFITGITEEIIFRGLVNSRLRRGYGRGAVIVISSVIFGIAHGTLLAVLYSALLGALFSLMYDKFNSVIPCILCHVFFNGTSYFIANLNGMALIGAYIISIGLSVYCVYSIFFKKPSFFDAVADSNGEYKLTDETERRIVEEFRSLGEEGSLTPDDIERLQDEWDEYHKSNKKKK